MQLICPSWQSACILPAAFSRFFDMPIRCQACTNHFDVPRTRPLWGWRQQLIPFRPIITHRGITLAGLPLTSRYWRGETITASPAPIAANFCYWPARTAHSILSS